MQSHSIMNRGKRQSQRLAYIRYLMSLDTAENTCADKHLSAAERIARCSTVWFGKKCLACGEIHSITTWGCRDRLCPLCAVRVSRATAAQAMQALQLMELPQGATMWLLTLTQKSVAGPNLPGEIDRLQAAWARLRHLRAVKRNVLGWARTVEVTANQGEDGRSYHAHVHVIVILGPGAPVTWAQNGAWREMWREAMELDYIPICDIRPVKDMGAVYEVSKYVTKVSRVLSADLGTAYEDITTLYQAIGGRRLRSYGGAWAKARKAAGMKEPEEMDETSMEQLGNSLDSTCRCGASAKDVESVCYMWAGNSYRKVEKHGSEF